jgi:hypothetical protein
MQRIRAGVRVGSGCFATDRLALPWLLLQQRQRQRRLYRPSPFSSRFQLRLLNFSNSSLNIPVSV